MASAKTLGELAVDVSVAESKFKDADDKYREASRYQTGCLNALNSAQAAFDTKLAEMKKSAHASSDWGRPAGRPTE